jgi:PRTase ComF-like
MNYALHKIFHPDQFGFQPDDYSRFKFGDDAAAQVFGRDLADGFIKDYLSQVPVDKPIVVVSSPYAFIPTATFAMKNHFVFRLNRWLVAHGHPVVEETKIHRTVTYKEDYGELDAAQRLQLIGNDSFHIDRGFLTGKTIIFLDDIKITGSHERMILRMVEEYRLDNEIHMLYFAELANKSIHPRIENFLNYHFVQSVFDLEDIIGRGTFMFNTRVVKYILSADPEAFGIFIERQEEQFIQRLFDMALGNSYHTIDAYIRNLESLRKITESYINQTQYGN